MIDAYKGQRDRLVNILKNEGIRNEKVLNAINNVPRHLFVPHLKQFAYENKALPIGDGQTISQPYIVARMTELLLIEDDMKVLEIGTGSGYQTSILANLCKFVYTIEKLPSLYYSVRDLLKKLGYNNVLCKLGDGTIGWEEHSPYDGIIITAAAPSLPEPLKKQVKTGGVIVLPEGDRNSQKLVRYRKIDENTFEKEEFEECIFVPLKGKYGW